MPLRIVACQGPIQLVTAVAVLRQRDRQSHDGYWDDCLIILDLAAPAEQEADFVAALMTMARALRRWKSITYASKIQLSAVGNLQASGNSQMWVEGANPADVKEVYVVREWQTFNQALLQAFPTATRICFGDSIGIYLAPTFMAARRSFSRRIVSSVRKFFKKRFFRQSMEASQLRENASADCYYLTLPEAFDAVPSRNVKVTEIGMLKNVVQDLRLLLPKFLLIELRQQMRGRRLVVLVGSNFSEQGIMSQDAEVAAYVEYLKIQSIGLDSLVILKPHPRDRRDKVAKLEVALGNIFQRVITLTDAVGFYLPLEALLLEILSNDDESLGMDICTFSSACLAAKYILGIQPRIGFGSDLVKKYFNGRFVDARLRHERQLSKACIHPLQMSNQS